MTLKTWKKFLKHCPEIRTLKEVSDISDHSKIRPFLPINHHLETEQVTHGLKEYIHNTSDNESDFFKGQKSQ